MTGTPSHPFAEAPNPLMRVLGYRPVEWREGFARIEMPIDPDVHVNGLGIPHGGTYATVLDTACAFAGTWRAPPAPRAGAMTLSLNLNFVGLPTGRLLIAEGRRTGGGASTFFADGELRDELGALVATASAVMRYTRPRPTSAGTTAEGAA